jgi:hypothetical protein
VSGGGSFSPEEWEKVRRFEFDRPEPVDDVEGMTFGVRLATVALLCGVLVVVGFAAVIVSVIL